MGEIDVLNKLSKEFINNLTRKKINKIKDKKERIAVFQNSIVSSLRLKHLDFELKLKRLKDKKKKNILSLKANLIPSKINLLQTNFNEKDFKKIDSLLNKLEEDEKNV